MNLGSTELLFHGNNTIPILDDAIPIQAYTRLDLSNSNPELNSIDITKHHQCQDYIDCVLTRNNALVAYGGYLEKRNLYSNKSNFTANGSRRNIHLGIDFWAAAGTTVMTPANGEVHSFQNNAAEGDYGPTIILKHDLNGSVFHTLYGHLSVASIDHLYEGKKFKKGEVLATLGTPDINVNYAPHLHFQLIIDLEGKKGDYPGVCSEEMLDFYQKNCPDPNLLLKI